MPCRLCPSARARSPTALLPTPILTRPRSLALVCTIGRLCVLAVSHYGLSNPLADSRGSRDFFYRHPRKKGCGEKVCSVRQPASAPRAARHARARALCRAKRERPTPPRAVTGGVECRKADCRRHNKKRNEMRHLCGYDHPTGSHALSQSLRAAEARGRMETSDLPSHSPFGRARL